MNSSVLFVFVLGVLLGVLRAADLALGTDAATGLCVVGSVWWRYLALGIVVLAAVLVGRKAGKKAEAVRSHQPLAGVLAFVGAVCFLAAAGVQFALGAAAEVSGFVRVILECLCSVWLSTMGRCWLSPNDWKKALRRAVSRRGGQPAVLLERADALYGELLQLAPGAAHGSGLAGAGSAGVPCGAGAGAARLAAGQCKDPVCRRACCVCAVPVLAAAPGGRSADRHRLGSPGCLGGNFCRDRPVLRGRHRRGVRCGLCKQSDLTKMLALCWRNCLKRESCAGQNRTKAKKLQLSC